MTDLSIETTKNILFGNPRWSDVEIHVWDGHHKQQAQCHAHRAILATFSGTIKNALLSKSDVITRPILTINEEWCSPALFEVVLRWMYTQTIYSKNVPALDKKKPETYKAQQDMLASVSKIAETFDMPGLVEACQKAQDRLKP